MQARVQSLLKAANDPDSLLDQPVSDVDATQVGDYPDVSLDFLEPCETPGSLGRLGSYAILEIIGRGGMGIVLRAEDSKLNRIVAIKLLAPQFAGNPLARKRFLREAQAAAAVSHDHVVTIHAVDDNQKLPYIVMECIVGQSLQQKLDKVGALGVKEILRIGMQTASGLAAAHAQGLVHRDIKPANILLENGIERVKLTDFGLARMVDDASVTQSGVIAGTPQFMSPEQARGDAIDHRSDLFSLGCVLYAMCVGHAPFRASTTMGVLKRVCDEKPQPIRQSNPDIPGWLVGAIDKLLAKSPADRFQTAGDVADLLRQSLAHLQQPSAVPLPESIRSLSAGASHSNTKAPQTHPGLKWAAASCLVAMAIGACFWQFSRVVLTARMSQRATNTQPLPMGTSSNAEPRNDPAEKALAAETSLATPTDAVVAPPQFRVGNAGAPPPLAVAPFDSVQAAEYQSAWAGYMRTLVEQSNSIGMKLRLIPPGRFQMGSTPEEMAGIRRELDEIGASEFDKFVAMSSGPRHLVELTRPFYMGQYEVTVAQFQTFVDKSGYQTSGEKVDNARFNWKKFIPDGDLDKTPVCGVSWDDASAFCKWLSDSESTSTAKVVYELPTEAQWEFACRAGSQTLWSFGDEPGSLSEHAIIGQQGTPKPASIGLRRANAFGLYDMHGNVDEWCLDWHNNQFYARSPLADPVFDIKPNDAASGRVARGGAWNSAPWWSRSTTRAYDFPTSPTFPKGFRVVKKLDKPPAESPVSEPEYR